MKFNNVIFDFDGTLVDTRSGIIKAFQMMMGDLGFEPAGQKTISELIGIPLAQFVKILLKTEDDAIIKEGASLFKKHYNEKYINDNIIYDGVYELLDSLKRHSIKSFVISNKIDIFLNQILEQRDIKKFFISVNGTDGTDAHSKKSDQVRNLIEKNCLNPAMTTIIGDRRDDIVAGKSNLIYAIGITYGYGSEEELIEAGADMVVKDTTDLKSFLI